MVFTIKVFYLYCNNNHLKLIDMKNFSLLVEIQDLEQCLKSVFYISICGNYTLSRAKRELGSRARFLSKSLHSNMTIFYNLNTVSVFEYNPLKND